MYGLGSRYPKVILNYVYPTLAHPLVVREKSESDDFRNDQKRHLLETALADRFAEFQG